MGFTASLQRLAKRKTVWFLTLAIGAVSLFFYLLSGLDIAISYLFYDSANGFFRASIAQYGDWRWVGLMVPKLIIGWFVTWIILRLIKGPPADPIFPTDKVGYVFLSGFLGTWVLINLIFKEYWGRPRPVQVDIFGGELPFVPVWEITDHCARNCSFISGEASSAIWSLSMLCFVPQRWFKFLIWPLSFIVLMLGLNRIMFGGHFASDVLLSILFTLLIMRVMWLFTQSRMGQSLFGAIDKGFAKTASLLKAEASAQ